MSCSSWPAPRSPESADDDDGGALPAGKPAAVGAGLSTTGAWAVSTPSMSACTSTYELPGEAGALCVT
jgi:hypothetical protein